jgi:hypothetical protein
MKSRTNYRIHQNATVARIECEQNVCESELQRLRYGLDRLLKNMSYDGFDGRRKSYRRWNRELRQKFSESRRNEMVVDSSCKSLLYKILEAKLLDCLGSNQKSFELFFKYKIFSYLIH